MMECNDLLKTRLTTATQLCIVDLLTFTLWDKSTVFRYTNLPFTFKCGSNNYVSLAFDIGELKRGIGFDVDNQDLNIYYNSDDKLTWNNANTTLAKAIRAGAFKWATVDHSQVFLDKWAFSADETYKMCIWKGRFGLNSASRSVAQIQIKSFTDILANKTPPNIYTAGCVNAMYGTACGVNEDNYTTGYTCLPGTNKNTLVFNTSQATNYYTGGYVYMSSGNNYGRYESISSYSLNGNVGTIVLRRALASAPSVGDTFNATAGCDHCVSTCNSRFNNYSKYRGYPFIPIPSTSVG